MNPYPKRIIFTHKDPRRVLFQAVPITVTFKPVSWPVFALEAEEGSAIVFKDVTSYFIKTKLTANQIISLFKEAEEWEVRGIGKDNKEKIVIRSDDVDQRFKAFSELIFPRFQNE